MEDGLIAITAGFLAWFKSEAFLASTLAHEYGHYKESHIFADYIKTTKNENNLFRLRLAGKDMGYARLYEYKRSQEEAADKYSCDLFMENEYHPNAIADEFREFKKINNRFEHLNYYRKWPAYLNSHPSDDQRIKNAETYFKNSTKSGKNFVVDSLLFEKVKKQAIDETIYLLFEQLRYEECIEIAYSQHLFYPEDQFYLYFLIECLRRQDGFIKNYQSEYFICGNYKNLVPDAISKTKEAVFVDGKSTKLKPKTYSNAIAANMQGVIYGFTENEIQNVKAKNLLFGTKLQFITNKEAFDYFKSLVPTNNSLFKNQNCVITKNKIPKLNENTQESELYNAFIKNYNEYQNVQDRLESFNRVPVLLKNFEIMNSNPKALITYDRNVELEILNKAYEKFLASYYNPSIQFSMEYNFREKYHIRNTVNFLDNLLHQKNIWGLSTKEFTKDFDFLAIFPELSALVSSHNFKKLIFLDISVANPRGIQGSLHFGEGAESWGVKYYIIDFKNKTISRKFVLYGGIFGDGTDRKDKLYSIMDMCETLADQK